MTALAVNLSEEQIKVLYQIADKEFGGNVSEAIRAALSKSHPTFATAKTLRSHRKRFTNSSELANMPVLVESTE